MRDPSLTLPDIDALWDFGDPAASEARFGQLLERMRGQAPADYLAQIHSQIARTHSLRADFAAAGCWLDEGEALCLAAETRGEDVRTARVRLLLERGRCLNSDGDPAAGAPLFQAALAAAEAAGEEHLACDAAHMLGIALPGEEGLAWNRRAIAMAEAARDPRARRWLGSLYNNSGWSLHDQGRYDEALELFEKSLTFREAQDPAGEAARIARWCRARCLRSLGRLEVALSEQRALLEAGRAARGAAEDIAADGGDANSDDADGDDGFVHEELGELLLALGRPDEARGHFARAHALLSRLTGLETLDEGRLARLQALGARGAGA